MSDDIQQVLDLPPCDQVGFVVHDIEAAIALYNPLFGPFTIMDPGPLTYDYRGQQEECDMRLAFGKSGDLEIELIQWVRGGCPHKEFLDAGREGVHHLRFLVRDMDAKVAEAQKLGYEAVWTTRYEAGLAVAYMQREGDDLTIELFENHSLMDEQQ
jgi:catechol 2,3-dioxygenase-like lactoylglutathione lyase family enzyme